MTRTLLLLLFLIVLAFAVRAGAISLLPGNELSNDYKRLYSPMAVNILNGNGLSISAGQPDYKLVPLYPLFLTALYLFFGADINIRMVLALMSAITCIFVYLIAKRIFGGKVALLSTLAFAVYPPLVLLPSIGSADTLFVLLNLAFVLYVVKFFETPSWRTGIIAGALLGLAGLTKPIPILLPLVLLTAFAIYARRSLSFGQQAKFAGLLLAFLLTIFPYSLRNYLVFQEAFILNVSRISLGDQLFVGTLESQLRANPDDTRSSVQYWDEWRQAITQEAGREVTDKQEQGSILTTVVAKKLLQEPLDFLRLLPRKFLRFWYASDSGRYDTIFMFLQGITVLTGLAGLALFLRTEGWRRAFPLFPALLYYPIIHTMSFPLARYSMPIMPLVMMFSAYTIVGLFNASRAYLGRLEVRG